MHRPDETIAALATPPGEGALAVVRVSGPGAKASLEALTGDEAPPRLEPRRLHRLLLRDPGGEVIDEVLAAWMPGPRSYTGEDLVEISAHGGHETVRALLAALARLGVRHAAPGEFTYRAFLSGRLDLVQAEAVAELIHSHSEAARALALSHLEGGLSRRLQPLREELLTLLRDLELGIDFAEEDVEPVSRETVHERLEALRAEVAALLAGARGGRLVREGARAVLAGAPNVGKSSIFNALLEQDRAIVTEAPGTTRDLLEESWTHRGLVFRLQDTAGLRAAGEAGDEAERLGTDRTEAALREAALGIWILDGARPLRDSERRRLAALDPGRDLVVINKRDLAGFDRRRADPFLPPGVRALSISARVGTGLDELREALFDLATGGAGQAILWAAAAVNRRQEARLAALHRDLEPLDRERVAALETELLARHLRDALSELEELTGARVGDKVLEDIFNNFCIGK